MMKPYKGKLTDNILREDAIKALCKSKCHPGVLCPDEYCLEVREVFDGIPSQSERTGWIPCSERLPEEKDAGILKKLGTTKRSDYVIATVEVKGERMTAIACTYDGAWDWNMKYAFPDYKIIAWMPLPEPYRK